jgi:hypothetical protein
MADRFVIPVPIGTDREAKEKIYVGVEHSDAGQLCVTLFGVPQKFGRPKGKMGKTPDGKPLAERNAYISKRMDELLTKKLSKKAAARVVALDVFVLKLSRSKLSSRHICRIYDRENSRTQK